MGLNFTAYDTLKPLYMMCDICRKQLIQPKPNGFKSLIIIIHVDGVEYIFSFVHFRDTLFYGDFNLLSIVTELQQYKSQEEEASLVLGCQCTEQGTIYKVYK